MLDKPTALEILAAVAEYRAGSSENSTSFEDRVADAAEELATRETNEAPRIHAMEHSRLVALLQTDDDLQQLNTLLCRRISNGELTLNTPGLSDHLWQTTLEKVAVDQPGFALYRRLTEKS